MLDVGSLVQAFAAPMLEHRQKLTPTGGSAQTAQDALTKAAEALTKLAESHRGASDALAGQWEGERADAFAQRWPKLQTALTDTAEQASKGGSEVGTALSKVQDGKAKVEQLIDEYTKKATAVLKAASAVGGIGGIGALLMGVVIVKAIASEYSGKSAEVLTAVRDALSDSAGKLKSLPSAPKLDGVTDSLGDDKAAKPTPSKRPETPKKPSGDATSPSGHGGGGGGGGGGGSSTSPSGHGGGGGGGNGSGGDGSPPPMTPPSSKFGSGTDITLPQGLGTVKAPNERAAKAVRAALTQLGVPYKWGGTTPGKGLDCSGLTQWAYKQGGVQLPRLAQEQGKGKKVSRDDLQPGDLIVWSGHVAMYVGEGKMIEAPKTGDVVKITNLRTSNGGQSFYGFYRPTA